MNPRRVPWLALGFPAAAGFLLGAAWLQRTFPLRLPACPMKTYLGIPCATCGLTRCGLALARGDWGGAFHWHPVAVILLLLSPLAMAWDSRRAWRGEAYPPLPDSLPLRLGVAGLLAGTWLLQILRGI
jgi:hypothetical protein